MTTQRRGRRSFRRPRAKTLWEQISPSALLASGGQATSDLTADVIAEHEHVAKATRIVGEFSVTGPTVAGRYNVAAGITVMSLDGFSGGNVPDPLTDTDQSWWYWTRMTPGLVSVDQGSDPVKFDIRTARNIRRGFRLILVFEAGVNPGSITFDLSARILWTLG